MNSKAHGPAICLFLIAGACYVAQWMGAAITLAILGAGIEFLAWIVYAIGQRKNIR